MPDAPSVVVVGASLGGVDALQRLAASLPPALPAAVLVVQHTSPGGPGLLGHLLDAAGPLQAALATDGEPLRPGVIRVAPPDQHLLVRDGRLRLARGPRENHARPALDVLFRSAAVARGSRVVGAVLTGLLNDGAAGLLAVQRCGGRTVVQAPEDAAHPEMPLSALARVRPDYVVPLAEMAALLGRLAPLPTPPSPPPPDDLVFEDQVAGGYIPPLPEAESWGQATSLSCPECGGALRERLEGPILRFRCHTGHAYVAQEILRDRSHEIERALWAAHRALKEHGATFRALARTERDNGHDDLAALYDARADDVREHVTKIYDDFLSQGF